MRYFETFLLYKAYRKIFSRFDEDGSGIVNLEEICGNLGITEEVARVELGKADRDGNCELDFSEFIKLIDLQKKSFELHEG